MAAIHQSLRKTQAYIGLGNLYSAQRDNREALPYFEKALEISLSEKWRSLASCFILI
ncbi:tetratricopeptide repeat protein [Candidatus Odyssella thessalonicensis]|uniref:tetratricopeptide repeat protein n=1 Tax=Candidatus Odyssella thessalonicensis TaxID=84647 RepID=UPI000309AE31